MKRRHHQRTSACRQCGKASGREFQKHATGENNGATSGQKKRPKLTRQF
jgi:hypothetical protein